MEELTEEEVIQQSIYDCGFHQGQTEEHKSTMDMLKRLGADKFSRIEQLKEDIEVIEAGINDPPFILEALQDKLKSLESKH